MNKQFLSLFLIFSLIGCKTNTADKEISKNINTSMQQKYSNPPKLIAFNDIDDLIKTIENSNTFFKFTNWRLIEIANKNDKTWFSHTGSIQFGAVSQNGTQNEIGYTIYGKEQNFVNEVRFILNIKNLEEKENALSGFSS